MLQPFDWIIQDYLPQLAESFINPQKRVSIFYLLVAMLIALFWSAWVSKETWTSGLKRGRHLLFSPKIWWSRSSISDYKLMFLNRAIMLLSAPIIISKIAVTTFLYFFFIDLLGTSEGALNSWPVWIAPVLYTFCLFTLDDFSRFFVHFCLHRFPVLWAFHKVHHSAETLTPITVYRTHPVEGIIFATRAVFVQAVTIALFVSLFGGSIELVEVYGVNILLFIFNFTGANLRHSHIRIAYPRVIEKILISPAQHQIHHSSDVSHFNCNFGAALAIWDRLARTLFTSERSQEITFGLSGQKKDNCHSLVNLYFGPFKEVRDLFSNFCLSGSFKTKSSKGKILLRYLNIKYLILIAALAILMGLPLRSANANEINVYSHRQPFLINPFLKAFEKKTGIKVNVVFSSKGLVQRLLAEGPRSPADVVLTVDIGRLYAYVDKKLFAAISSKKLSSNIPPHLRDSGNRWFGLSKRARIVAIAKGRVKPSEIKRVEDLSNPKWKGRICSRPGSHVYNRALLASLIAAHGEKAAEAWARGLVSNLARRPQGNDRAQVKAIYEGVCDIAIINSYYYGKLKTSKIAAQRGWADSMQIVFTNQSDRGNHVNISGGGVAKYSKNKGSAVKLLEFLTEQTAQTLYGKINYEFPINPKTVPSSEVKSWGSFKEDNLRIEKIAALTPIAQRIIDRVGW